MLGGWALPDHGLSVAEAFQSETVGDGVARACPALPSASGLQAAGAGQQPWKVLEPEVIGVMVCTSAGHLCGCCPRSVPCLSFCCASVRGFVPWTLVLCLPAAVFLHLLSDLARTNVHVSHLGTSGSPALGSCAFLPAAWCTWPLLPGENCLPVPGMPWALGLVLLLGGELFPAPSALREEGDRRGPCSSGLVAAVGGPQAGGGLAWTLGWNTGGLGWRRPSGLPRGWVEAGTGHLHASRTWEQQGR